MTVTVPYDYGDVVTIKALDIDAIVDAVKVNAGGAEIGVAYWWNGERRSIWVLPVEIEKLEVLP